MRIIGLAVTLAAIGLLAAGCNTTKGSAEPPAAQLQPSAESSEFVALGSGGVRHLPSGTEFPAVYDDFPMSSYMSRPLDAHVHYRRPDRPVVSFFMYLPQDAPNLRVERGAGSPSVEAEYQRSNQGFAELARSGLFRDLRFVLLNSNIDLRTKSGILPAKWSIVRYRDTRGGGPHIGHLILTGYQGRFLKIRVSYPDFIKEEPPADPSQKDPKHFERLAASMVLATGILEKTGAFLE